MIKVIIDGIEIEAKDGSTILEVAQLAKIDIPTLCYDKRLLTPGGCKLCMVEVEGAKTLRMSCCVKATDGMVVYTESEVAIEERKKLLKGILEKHPLDCMTCNKAGDCRLQDLAYRYDMKDIELVDDGETYEIDYSNKFFTVDQNKCVYCKKCERMCTQLQCNKAIKPIKRGVKFEINTQVDEKVKYGACVSCGNCVSICPVGCLMPKSSDKFRTWEVKKVATTCSYCGVGCQMNLIVKDDKVVSVEPIDKTPNDGLLCVKGKFAYKFIDHKDRLTTPLIKKDGEFVQVSYDEAINFIVSKLKSIKKDFGADAIGGLSSARCTNEENYLMQKFIRAVIGTNNIDHCARLCHANTVSGLADSLGSGAMTNSIEEIKDAKTIFVIGSNTTETHPVIGTLVKRAKNKKCKLIVADPRNIELCEIADIYMPLKPGTNVALLNGIMNVIINENLQDLEYIKERCQDYTEFKKVIEEYTPEKVEEITGVDKELIIEAARTYANSESATILYSMGITQHINGVDNVLSTSNLAMLCGFIGKENTGVNPLRGQNNVQGACDMGALPNVYPGYQKVNDEKIREKFQREWGTELSDKAGLTVSEMMDEAIEGKLKALYIMGENPMVSDPDIKHVKKALENLDLVVVQDIFLTETADLADVVLPAVSFAEKEGTFTNTERRIQRVRKAVSPKGESMADWEIIMKIMKGFHCDTHYNNASEIMDEIARVTPSYGGISHERLEEEGIQWPCPDYNHKGTKYLHKDKFVRGKGLFKALHYKLPAESKSEKYPIILTTGRILYHYHTATMTDKTEGIMDIAGECFLELNPKLAESYNIKNGEKIRVSSRRGKVEVKALITDKIQEDVVFMPFHYAKAAANQLTNTAWDNKTKQPELKVCAVSIEKIG